MTAKLIQVIELDLLRGTGVTGDACRRVTQYWSTDGLLLAENDPSVRISVRVSDRGAGAP